MRLDMSSHWDTLTSKLETLCSSLFILLIASSQKGEASRGELGPLGQQIWVGHGLRSQPCAALVCLSPPI